ncbi:MAG: glycosyltransferase family 2 protein [Chloroflexi bacterium]|nr:glycosyltransferase family 2 protein [Chloroflexota bacterium]
MSSNKPGLVSVVIPNWNGLRHLPECLGSVVRQTLRPAEVVLVDNGSVDGSLEYVANQYPSVVVIRNPTNYGFARAANQGILRATGEFVLLLNNDTRLEEGFLANVMNAWAKADERVIGVLPKALYHDRPTVINSIGARWRSWRIWEDYGDGVEDRGQFDQARRVFGGAFIAVCLRADLSRRIGLLDERFVSYGEDLDFCYRANCLGYSFVTCPQARVYHKSHSTMTDNQLRGPRHHFYRFGLRNCLMGIIKNYERRNLLLRLPFSLLHLLGYVGILYPLRRFGIARLPEILLVNALVVWELATALPYLVEKRGAIQRARQVRDADIWRLNTESAPDSFGKAVAQCRATKVSEA